MNIVVVNGTEVRGCTYHIKEAFLAPLRAGNTVTEFYLPRDLKSFCCGCKTCFFKDERLCPHAAQVMPIWTAFLQAELIVFATPVYALRAPGQVKALLDHLCCHWMVHRPDPALFTKRAVVLTNAIGPMNGGAQRDIATSLNWLGVSSVYRLGFGLFEGVVWDQLSQKRRAKMEAKTARLARHCLARGPARKGLKVRAYFFVCKCIHRQVLKSEPTPSADNQHWLDHGWL